MTTVVLFSKVTRQQDKKKPSDLVWKFSFVPAGKQGRASTPARRTFRLSVLWFMEIEILYSNIHLALSACGCQQSVNGETIPSVGRVAGVGVG